MKKKVLFFMVICLILSVFGNFAFAQRSEFLSLYNVIDKLFGDSIGLRQEQVIGEIDRVVDVYAGIHTSFTGKEITERQKNILKGGLKLFTRSYFERYQGKSDFVKAMQIVKDILANRDLLMNIMLSSDSEELVAQKLEMFGVGDAVSKGPIGIYEQLIFPTEPNTNDLQVVKEKLFMISDVGLSGHMNGAIDAGETITINITLTNKSNKQYISSSGFLETDSPYVAVDRNEVVYDETAPEQENTPQANFLLNISPDCPDAEEIPFKLLVWDTDFGKSYEHFKIKVFNVGPLVFGEAVIDDDIPGPSDGNADGIMEAGETIEFRLKIKNEGEPSISDIKARLSCDKKFIEINQDLLSYPGIKGKTIEGIRIDYDFYVSEDEIVYSLQGEINKEQTVVLKLTTTAKSRWFYYTWQTLFIQKVVIPDKLLVKIKEIPEDMVFIPAGEFLMGSNDGEPDEKPIHTVYLDAYYIDKYEVTNKQYREFVEATGHREPVYWGEDDHPVVYVRREDAVAYATWAGKRLPTEAEWEKAARGGLDGKKNPWGNRDPDGSDCNFADKNTNYSWTDKSIDDGYSHTAPVGTYPPNNHGLYDMAGNVWEWVSDWYDDNYYANSPSKNPQGPNNASYRVRRGGSWSRDAGSLRCANRYYGSPDLTYNNLGFRCVKSP